MKHFNISALISVLCTVGLFVSARADTALVNGTTWTYTVDGGVATVGNGSSAAISTATAKAVTVPDTLGGYPVVAVADKAFYNCASVTGVTFPKSVTQVGSHVFYKCGKVTSLIMFAPEINATPTSFSGLGALKTLKCGVFPSGRTVDAPAPVGYSTPVPSGWSVDYSSQAGTVYRSSNIGNYGSTTMSASFNLQKSGTLKFRWKVSSESNCDYLKYSVDDVQREQISGEKDWQEVAVPLAGGNHTVSWTYSKDRSSSVGSDCGWVEILSLTGPGERVPVSTPVKELFPNTYRTIMNLSIAPGAQSVSDNFASGLPSLRNVVIPSSVRTIFGAAFAGETTITNVTVAGGVRVAEIFADSIDKIARAALASDSTAVCANMFEGCTALAYVWMPSTVTHIGDNAFRGCSRLAKVVYPDALRLDRNDVVRIGFEEAYLKRCRVNNSVVLGRNLVYATNPDQITLTVPSEVFYIGEEAAAEMIKLRRIVFPDTVKEIGSYAFSTCTALEEVVFPEGLSVIGEGAFENCTWVNDVVFPSTLRSVGDYAFHNCTELLTVDIPEGTVSVGDGAFENCWRLISAKLPHSLTNLGDTVFQDCYFITGVQIPSNLRTLANIFPDSRAWIKFASIPSGETEIMSSMFSRCSALDTIEIPATVTNIGSRAFESCSSLVEQALPNSVVSLGNSAFYGCTALERVSLSRRLERLEYQTFYNCHRLSSLIVPASVTSLGNSLFCSCITDSEHHMRDVYFLGNAPEAVSPYQDACGDLVTHVVAGSTGWDGIASSRSLPYRWEGRVITTWSPNIFEVTFDSNGGSPINPYTEQEITDTTYALPIQRPTRAGYVFDGWWTAPSGGGEVIDTTIVRATRAHTLYAHWLSTPAVKMYFNANGGTVTPTSRTYYAHKTFQGFPVPTRRGFQFAGWWTSWDAGRHISEGDEVPELPQTFYAHWTPNVYKVVFHSNNGADHKVYQAFTFNEEQALRDNPFVWARHCFVGWAKSPTGPVVYADKARILNLTEVDGQFIPLYAKWAADTFAVRFDGNGGSGRMANQTFTYGVAQNLAPNAYKYTGYTFKGWALTPTGPVVHTDGKSVKNLTDEKTITLYAVWQRDYAIIFSRYDGSGTTATNYFTVGVKQALPALAALKWARRGYVFKGWAVSTADAIAGKVWKADGADVKDAATVAAPKTVYAVWALKSGYYQLRFNKNDGSGRWRTVAFAYGTKMRLPSCAIGLGWSRPGYTFAGWSLGANATAVWKGDWAYVSTPFAAGTTRGVYAIWRRSAAANVVLPNRAAVRLSADTEPAVSVPPQVVAGELLDGSGLVQLVVYPDGEAVVQIDFSDGTSSVGFGMAEGVGGCWLVVLEDGAEFAVIED